MVAAFVQARLGSTRLPGKTLLPFAERTVLDIQLERLRMETGLTQIVVLTSDSAVDDPLYTHCLQQGYEVLRGPEQDVAQRFADACHRYQPPAFLRYCADRVAFDPLLLSRALEIWSNAEVDIVTNIHPATFPRGQSVEIIRSETFLTYCGKFQDSYEREHVTPYFYRTANAHRIENFTSGERYRPQRSLTLDTEADYRSLQWLAQTSGNSFLRLSWQHSLALLEKYQDNACVE